MTNHYRLFAWNLSYFSAKIRAYLRFKEFHGVLSYEEILATQDIIDAIIKPATGTNVVPQLQGADGRWFQDSSEIIDLLEAANPQAPVIPTGPKQKLVSYLVELLADEWMLPWGFWERWHHTQKKNSPNHEVFNALQWGRIFNVDGTGSERIAAGRFAFGEAKLDDPDNAPGGPIVGLTQLGVTPKTQEAWTESMMDMLACLEAHFDLHDYILGGQPSLADFALLGPLYPHLYKDPVPGFMIRTQYPMVSEWIERVNGSKEAGYKSYREPQYRLVDGELVKQQPGTILPNDEVPATLLPLLQIFFSEMWPMLKDTVHVVREFAAAAPDSDLPGKTFHSSAEFKDAQSGDGGLTLEFQIGDEHERRMASPYHVWMLQRMSDAIASDKPELVSFVNAFEEGAELLDLENLLADCRLVKEFEKLTLAK
ncbi:MAG: glutathione S-transferase family protein [Halioglobus sp.]